MIIASILFLGCIPFLNAMEETDDTVSSHTPILSTAGQQPDHHVRFSEDVHVRYFNKELDPMNVHERSTIIMQLGSPIKENDIADVSSPLKSILKVSPAGQKTPHYVHFDHQVLVQDFDEELEPIDINEKNTTIEFLKAPAMDADSTLTSTVNKLIKSLKSEADLDKLDSFTPDILQSEVTVPIIYDIFKNYLKAEAEKDLTFEIRHKQNLLPFLGKLSEIKYDMLSPELFKKEIALVDMLIITFVHIKTLTNYKMKHEYWQTELVHALDAEYEDFCSSILADNCYCREGGEPAFRSKLQIKEKTYENIWAFLQKTNAYQSITNP